MCLAVTKFVLRKINFGVWFIQTFLQKMHQIRQKKQNAAKENESNPAEEKMRSRGECDIERRRGRCDRPTSGARPTSALVDRDHRSRSSIAPLDRRSHRAISSIIIVDRAARRCGAIVEQVARSGLSLLSLSLWSGLSLLSLSLFFRKWFEVKIRVENHFRVKGENIGQPEVIFRKISFSVTAKHAGLGKNDFLKSFSPKTNAP